MRAGALCHFRTSERFGFRSESSKKALSLERLRAPRFISGRQRPLGALHADRTLLYFIVMSVRYMCVYRQIRVLLFLTELCIVYYEVINNLVAFCLITFLII